MEDRNEGAYGIQREKILNVKLLLKNQDTWKPEKHLGTLSVAKKVRVDWDPLFLLLFLLFEAFVLLYTSRMLRNDSCVAAALCHMQEQLWVFLSRPLYMIHRTLGKKGVLPSACKQMDGIGVLTTSRLPPLWKRQIQSCATYIWI